MAKYDLPRPMQGIKSDDVRKDLQKSNKYAFPFTDDNLDRALPFLLAPVVYALTLHVPSSLVIGEETTITWNHTSTDPNFTLFLMGTTDPFDSRQIIAENLSASQGSITTMFDTIRVLPSVNYQLRAVNVTWVDFVYTISPNFQVHN